MPMDLVIREEAAADAAAIRRLHLAAFGGEVEAKLVDTLRHTCRENLSLVAIDKDSLVGHILFSPVMLRDGDRTLHGMGLGPMAVLPSHQRQGIGSRLVRRGLALLRDARCPFVVVLGHPGYYPRFGFVPASRHGIRCQWSGVPDAAFMVLVLQPAAMPRGGGIARYREAFDAAAAETP
jgi:putative acetyltransferase